MSVSDDGRGIDLARLHAKAVARGLVEADRQLTQRELCTLVFAPKLSTADEVSEISGRGEGMAALAEAVARCHGAIDVQTITGQGTKIIIDLPKLPKEALKEASPGEPGYRDRLG